MLGTMVRRMPVHSSSPGDGVELPKPAAIGGMAIQWLAWRHSVNADDENHYLAWWRVVDRLA